MQDDGETGMTLGLIGGKHRFFVSDEEKSGRLLPEFDFPTEIGFEGFRLMLAEPSTEQEFDAADDEK